MVYAALSHDIIAHEMTHALLDGIHKAFREPSNPDVLAFTRPSPISSRCSSSSQISTSSAAKAPPSEAILVEVSREVLNRADVSAKRGPGVVAGLQFFRHQLA